MRACFLLLASLALAALVALPAGAQSHAERYAQAQVREAVAASKAVRRDSGQPGTATVTRSYPYAEPSYGDGTPAPEISGVKVYRSGYEGPTRPCSYQGGVSGVTTYTGCPQGYAYAAGGSAELSGGRRMAGSGDIITVKAVERGVCGRRIARRPGDPARATRYDVCYADLQPVHGVRVDDLYERLERAARRACGGQAGYGAGWRRTDCVAQALERAVYDTGLQSLVNHHNGETGQALRIILTGPRRD